MVRTRGYGGENLIIVSPQRRRRKTAQVFFIRDPSPGTHSHIEGGGRGPEKKSSATPTQRLGRQNKMNYPRKNTTGLSKIEILNDSYSGEGVKQLARKVHEEKEVESLAGD